MSNEDIVRIEKRTEQRGPGRPRSIPVLPSDEVTAEVMRQRNRHVDNDELVQTVEEDPDSLDVLDALMKNFATEASALEFDRKEAERKAEDTSTYASKRVTALKALSQTWFKKRNMILDEAFDFSSKKFQTLFKFWFEKVRKAAEMSDLEEERIRVFFKNLEKVFDGWEEEARKYIKTRF